MARSKKKQRAAIDLDSVEAVSLDAFGTILELLPPAPDLIRELAVRWGFEISEEEAWQALGAEIGYYRSHHLEGHDQASLIDLRLRCAGVLLENLPEEVQEKLTAAELLPAMLGSLQFRPYPDVEDALARIRRAGLPAVVVSNWDISLIEVLEQCGLAGYIDHVVSSATVGAAKPAPAAFRRAAELLDLPPERIVHIGDEPELDVAGARAAGMQAVLLRRYGDPDDAATAGDAATPVITTLTDFPVG